jgi:DNA-binding winged helix-turn-helix (wHTH) protein
MATLNRFGTFQLDIEGGRLLKNGRVIRLKPQPFRLLQLLVSRHGELVSRDDIRLLLWGTDTFVDFEQGMNAAIRQIRDALGDNAESPIYVETVPKRGYRFIAPVEVDGPPARRPATTDLKLQKALWLNIVELRLAEIRRKNARRRLVIALAVAAVLAGIAAGLISMLR